MPHASPNDGAMLGPMAATGDGRAMATRTRKEQVQGKQAPRLIVASIFCGPLAGLVLVTIFLIIIALLTAADGGPVDSIPVALVIGSALYGAIIGWPMMLIFGLPAHAFLYRRKS